MKHVMTYENFKPKNISTRDVDARNKGIFVYNGTEKYIIEDQIHTFHMLLTNKYDSKWFIFDVDLYKNKTDEISDFNILISNDLKEVKMSGLKKLNIPDQELEKLCLRITRESLNDINIHRRGLKLSSAELYAVSDLLYPKVLKAFQNLK